MLPFGFCWLGGLMGSTPPPADDPEPPPLLPMTPTPLPGASPLPTGLSDMREDGPPPTTPRPRIPPPGAEEPNRPAVEDVGPPTVTPPREPGRLQPMALEEAAWA